MLLIAGTREKDDIGILVVGLQFFVALFWKRAKTDLDVFAVVNFIEIQIHPDEVADLFNFAGKSLHFLLRLSAFCL